MAKRYIDPRTSDHIKNKTNPKKITGTIRYISASAHLGNEHSRKDDLESVALMCIYFLKGKLPWQGVNTGNEKAN
jgi:hypothetical protein